MRPFDPYLRDGFDATHRQRSNAAENHIGVFITDSYYSENVDCNNIAESTFSPHHDDPKKYHSLYVCSQRHLGILT